MNKSFLVALVVFLVACNNNVGDEPLTPKEEETGSRVEVSPLHQLFQQSSFIQFVAATDPSFSFDHFQPAGDLQLSGVQSNFTPAGIEPYKDLLIYNQDSSRAVDLFSYGTFLQEKRLRGGEPDSEAALLDFSTRTRKRLLYLGPSYAFTSATIDADRITISGYESRSDEKLKPLFWVINLQQKQVQMYEYNGTVKANVSEFFRQQFPDYTFD